jgi:uncharacterized protein YjiK
LLLAVAPAALAGGASPTPPAVRDAVEVQSVLTGEFGFPRPAGIAYVRHKQMILVAQSKGSRTKLLRLTPLGKARGVVGIPRLARPSTLAFDTERKRVVAVSAKRLTTVESTSLAAKTPPVSHQDISYLGLRQPQAATFDAGNRLLVLDTASQEIVRVPTTRSAAPVRTSLRALGARTLRGLAYNPTDRLVYVYSPDRELLFGLDGNGNVRKAFNLRSASLEAVTSIEFGPSTDSTDARATQHLFATDLGGPRALGRVAELSLARPVSLPSSVTGRLVRTTRTSKLQSPSPDPSGIVYVPATDQLLVSDSEVEELPMYRGANLFFLERSGSLSRTETTLAFSREPTGVAFDPSTSTLFVSDDDKRAVFVDEPGSDGRHGTADDTVVRINTSVFGNRDPEDVTFDQETGHLFVADGVNAEIYGVNPVNGSFGDGDDTVTHFDVATYGIHNIEGLGYDAKRRTLLVVADRERRILELTRSGGLVRIISLAPIPGARWLSGVAIAPTSSPTDAPGATSYWVTDRQVDNNQSPKENDGRLYEIVLP